MTGICGSDKESFKSDKESYVGELTISELATGFTDMCLKNEKMCQRILKQNLFIAQLEAEKEEHLFIIANLKEEVLQK